MKNNILLVLFSLLVIFISCESPTKNKNSDEITIYLTGVEVTPLDKEINNGVANYFYSDTLTNQLYFEVNAKYKVKGGTLEEFYDSIKDESDNVAVDVRLPRVSNPLETGKCWFKCNKNFECDGIEIKANTNILKYPEIEDNYYFTLGISAFASNEVILDTEKFKFENGKYKFYFGWENVKGKVLDDEIDVFLNLNN